MPRGARLGQHFLHDPDFIERSVAAISPRRGDSLVEIGPGRGALTIPLLARAGSLDAIEIDRELAGRLGPRPGLRIHVGDALEWPFEGLATGGNRLRIAGNLPYYLSTPLLFRLFEQADAIEDMHFMLQREVVERMTAEPGTSAYGRLGLMVRCHAEAKALFEVPRRRSGPRPGCGPRSSGSGPIGRARSEMWTGFAAWSPGRSLNGESGSATPFAGRSTRRRSAPAGWTRTGGPEP